VAIFAERGCHVVSVTISYSRILGFKDRSLYFFFQAAPQLWTPIQTHYFSENMVETGIEHGPLSGSVAKNSDH
jgi:hypothetical protein